MHGAFNLAAHVNAPSIDVHGSPIKLSTWERALRDLKNGSILRLFRFDWFSSFFLLNSATLLAWPP